MARIEKVTMTNMCMVFDGNKVLVQDKTDDDYSGIIFPGGHVEKGESFTDAVIRHLAAERDGIVYLLWGSYAQKKAAFVDTTRNLVLKSAHPSPLSSYRGFFGCGHFKTANEYLTAHGQEPVVW